MNTIQHLVMFSGGVCSWSDAKRVVARHGLEGVALLFADTFIEDDDLYRFLIQGAANILGGPAVEDLVTLTQSLPPLQETEARKASLQSLAVLTQQRLPGFHWIAEGRTPWQLMADEKMIANSSADFCSKLLKRHFMDRWVKAHTQPAETVLHFGIDWSESHRLEKLRRLKAPYRVEAYMNEPPLLSKPQMLETLLRERICPPRLYGMGFPHNNCGGFCVKAGQAHFAHLLRVMPERYRYHEEQEEIMRTRVGNYSIMRSRPVRKKPIPLPMRELRHRIETQQEFDTEEWGGCGCAVG